MAFSIEAHYHFNIQVTAYTGNVLLDRMAPVTLQYPSFQYVGIFPRVATVMEKVMEKKFQDHGRVREFCLLSVKMSNFEKVRENQFWLGNFLLLEYTYSSQICTKDLLP